MPCSSIARIAPTPAWPCAAAAAASSQGVESFIPIRAIASGTAQCACTSTVPDAPAADHQPSRRCACAARRCGGQEITADERDAGQRAGGSSRGTLCACSWWLSRDWCVALHRARGCSQTPAASSGGKLRPAWQRGLWPLAVVGAFVVGWAAAGAVGRTTAVRDAARETEHLKATSLDAAGSPACPEELAAARAAASSPDARAPSAPPSLG